MDELYTMPLLIFFYIYVYDTVIDPNSAQVDQMRHCEIMQALWLSTGNIRKEDMHKFGTKEFDSLGLLSNKTRAEQAEERVEKEKQIAEEQAKQQRANMLAWMGVKPDGK